MSEAEGTAVDDTPDGSAEVEAVVEGIQGRDRRALAKAITLIESRRGDRAEVGQEVLERVMPLTGGSIRLGVSGIPGVGKSTLIDALGKLLLDRGQRVAVLAVDPSSTVSGGSILGDKSRMPHLAADERAFIRPSPTAANLGGVARRTREAILLAEAAGYDVVLVETVGVGQSEVEVAQMVDFFALLLLPGSGDELQGLKKGIVELADVIVIHKADGDLADQARRTANDYRAALRYLGASGTAREVEVLTASAHEGEGIEELWSLVQERWEKDRTSGALDERRRAQQRQWFRRLVEEKVMDEFLSRAGVASRFESLESEVAAGRKTAGGAADELVAATRSN
ncbi:MAG: methylmalonyl Co-A mutase-associated GTPase MeaB [Thermoanaerobaculia bacterium]|nr:methylmalonyl Co-A mutase-associated GTPase MeaB [Thermoanaerobaculia bacterium]